MLPLTIVRFLTFEAERKYGAAKPRPVATFVVVTIFSLSGVLNAVLYRLTRASTFRRVPRTIPTGPLVGDARDNQQEREQHAIEVFVRPGGSAAIH